VPFVDVAALTPLEKRPGWRGRRFHSPSMTFGHWTFVAGAEIGEHSHPQEEVWHVVEGELEITVDGVMAVVREGVAAIVAPDAPHAVRALSDGRAIVVDHPRRDAF
jgi:quercetin dioxygenase-like cupin family protein